MPAKVATSAGRQLGPSSSSSSSPDGGTTASSPRGGAGGQPESVFNDPAMRGYACCAAAVGVLGFGLLLAGVFVWSATTSVDLRLDRIAQYNHIATEWSSTYRKDFEQEKCYVQGRAMDKDTTDEKIDDLVDAYGTNVGVEYTPLFYSSTIEVQGGETSFDIVMGTTPIKTLLLPACESAIVGVGECTVDCDGVTSSTPCVECDYACSLVHGRWSTGDEVCNVFQQLKSIDLLVEKSAMAYTYESGFQLEGANHQADANYSSTMANCSGDTMKVQVTLRSTRDPYVRAAELTDYSMLFGKSRTWFRETVLFGFMLFGGGLMLLGAAASLGFWASTRSRVRHLTSSIARHGEGQRLPLTQHGHGHSMGTMRGGSPMAAGMGGRHAGSPAGSRLSSTADYSPAGSSSFGSSPAGNMARRALGPGGLSSPAGLTSYQRTANSSML